jgi:hypothetical protein
MKALSGNMSNDGMTATRLVAGAVMSAATGVCFAVGFDFKVMLRIPIAQHKLRATHQVLRG